MATAGARANGGTRTSLARSGRRRTAYSHPTTSTTRSIRPTPRITNPRTRRRSQMEIDEEARFWSKVDRSGGPESCWPWVCGKDTKGYGCCRIGPRKQTCAHRVSWQISRGDIPPGLLVCHRCDNPPCCNPAHLFLGTNTDNMRDCSAKGRIPKGDSHHTRTRPELVPRGSTHSSAKLTEADVVCIRKMLASGRTHYDIAAAFGVSRSAVSNIAVGKVWKHVAPVAAIRSNP